MPLAQRYDRHAIVNHGASASVTNHDPCFMPDEIAASMPLLTTIYAEHIDDVRSAADYNSASLWRLCCHSRAERQLRDMT